MHHRALITANLLGHHFSFEAAPGLFSSDRIDDGTRLLLEHLPPTPPKRFLDLGCGYGALGLPIAKTHPTAECLLVDRDALAVEYALRNARTLGLENVQAKPSLGYRDIGEHTYDWILCNIPARIGEQAIAYFLSEGARRLKSGGELRVVVIRDLQPVVERLAVHHRWSIASCAHSPRHAVYTMPPRPNPPTPDSEGVYLLDHVKVAELELDRPQDVSEEPAHLEHGLPLLLDLLPRSGIQKALVFRGGYGAAAILLASRGIAVTAVDRDLLATTFTRRNAAKRGQHVETRDAHALGQALGPDEKHDAFVGELHVATDDASARQDILDSVRHTRPGGPILWLGRTRQGWRVLKPLASQGGIMAQVLASREAYSVWRLKG